ncbi:glycosyltransferase family 2 protein [Rhodoferax sp. GW822-FHT02A01]|uniref:glycosyltransferase family 2 protein n=1 Tax=Rhodoferax sp. GW822-FHT02A01 TaxID=3141537 RepID=UPI00315DE57D
MPHADLISLVITTYNRSDALAAVLKALAAQDDKGFEIVIADDGSTQEHQDSARAAILRNGLSATHVWHPDVGFTASQVRNLGVAAAKGDYVVLLDGDCVPETDFVRRHRLLSETGFFVNGSRVMLSEPFTTEVLQNRVTVFGRNWPFWLGRRLAGESSKWAALMRLPDFAGRKHAEFKWKGIRSCNMGVWRQDYEAINGFDESFVGWGHEDADFVLRLHNAGIKRKNGFCATEVFHLWHKQSSRSEESRNAALVRQRMGSGQTQATLGYRESLGAKDVVISRWG